MTSLGNIFVNMFNVLKILLFSSLLMLPSALLAAGSIGTSGADFLEIGVGSRPLAMGEAFTAQTNDINTIYYNPAGIASIRFPLLSILHQELIFDSRFENVSFVYPIWKGKAAVSNSAFWVPGFQKVDIDGNNSGNISFYDGVFSAGYAHDFGNLYVGGTLKYVYQKVDEVFANSLAVDLGVLKGFYLYSPFDSPVRNFHIGMSLLNLGTDAHGDPLPRSLRLGLSYRPTYWVCVNMDITESMIAKSDLYDFTYLFEESFRMNWGVEFNYLEILFLRGGWKFNDSSSYSLGMGFNYSIGNVAFQVDMGYAGTGELGPTYAFDFTFKLIPKVITVEAKIKAESHYKKGIKHFIADDLDSAIEEFNMTRDYNPYHKNIERKIKDLNKIKELREKNKELEEEERDKVYTDTPF